MHNTHTYKKKMLLA
uniref:Uncharacterized protein n=1 Tax=Anguilla anguilla TaxID=7936 RepID=A0A0E9RUJ5_ANGAN